MGDRCQQIVANIKINGQRIEDDYYQPYMGDFGADWHPAVEKFCRESGLELLDFKVMGMKERLRLMDGGEVHRRWMVFVRL